MTESTEKTAAVSPAAETPETKQTMDILEIMSILPHRYPFLLIDRVVEIEQEAAHRGHQECFVQ